MTSGPEIGKYDPFEDTGDWPFRDAPPKHEGETVLGDAADEPFDARGGEETAFAPALEPDELTPEDVVPSPEEILAEELDEPEAAPASEEPPAAALPVELEEALAVEEALLVEEPEVVEAEEDAAQSVESDEHAPGTLVVPPGTDILSGAPHGFRRSVAVVVSRFNGDITTGLLESALAALRECNVADDAVTVVPVPGAFELPLTAFALAKTRRFSCVVALGCVIRGETAHFDLVAGEAASGLQLAAIETGIPVAFGLITCETREQAEARIDRGAEAARTALEMADLFSHVRTRAAAS
jgi:6,7-dimethyl-8-ribityllumazine synthase